jgi:hypothetical protein
VCVIYFPHMLFISFHEINKVIILPSSKSNRQFIVKNNINEMMNVVSFMLFFTINGRLDLGGVRRIILLVS